jgi:hypothetical protein
MKSVKFAVLFGALSLVFMGCPYESKYPVDEAHVKIDKSVMGDWDCQGEDDYTYTISADGSDQYKIVKKKKKGDDEPTTYIGFVSNVDAESNYLNLYEESESSSSSTDRKYYIYKYTKIDGRFKILGVTDNITEEFNSSSELKSYIKKYQDLSFFFDKDEEKKFQKPF